MALLHRVDRTYKLYIGGKQARPDAPYAQAITNAQGHTLALIPEANRKDVRNAVEAAHAAFPGWSLRAAHNRAQIVYYLYAARSEPVHAQLIDFLRVVAGRRTLRFVVRSLPP